MLIERQFLSAEDLERALELQKERGEKIGKILVDGGYCSARDVMATLGRPAPSTANHNRRSARDLARNREAFAAIPAPVPLPANRAA
jgi:hypothetical protein